MANVKCTKFSRAAAASESSKGTLSGDTWTWTSSSNYGGMEIQGKMTIKTVTPTSYTMKYEVSTRSHPRALGSFPLMWAVRQPVRASRSNCQ